MQKFMSFMIVALGFSYAQADYVCTGAKSDLRVEMDASDPILIKLRLLRNGNEVSKGTAGISSETTMRSGTARVTTHEGFYAGNKDSLVPFKMSDTEINDSNGFRKYKTIMIDGVGFGCHIPQDE